MEKCQNTNGGTSPDPNRDLKPNGKKDYWKIVRRNFLHTDSHLKKHNSTANQMLNLLGNDLIDSEIKKNLSSENDESQ